MKPLEYRAWFRSNRNKALSNLIEFISSELPQRNTTVLFLLLSKEYKAECSLFQEFCKQLKGPDRLLFVAESHDVAEGWTQKVLEFLEPSQIDRIGVVGMPWMEFNLFMETTLGGSVRHGLCLPSPNGVPMDVNVHTINQNIINPLGLSQSSELSDLELKDRQKRGTKIELSFYKGYTVTWDNFWFTDHGFNHVLKRTIVDELIEKIKKLLKMPPTEGRVFTLEVKHEVGAGVTTIGRHVLWILSRSKPYMCRCCVIKQISDDTCRELLHFRRCGSDELSENTLPVLAFVDKFQGDLFDELKSEASLEAQSLPPCDLPVIVFVKTTEYPTLPKESEVDIDTTVFVRQKLDRKEQIWFERKLNEMSKKYDESFRGFQKYASEHLITFMMMKHNFKRDYVTSVVERCLQSATPEEKLLLKYLSLLSYGGARPVFERVFDQIMLSAEFRNRAFLSDWFTELTESTRVLLKETDMSENAGTGTGIEIVHPLLAEAILEYYTAFQPDALANCVTELLGSAVCTCESSFTGKHCRYAISSMLTHRPVNDDGEQARFSRLIEKILYGRLMSRNEKFRASEAGVSQAKSILVKGLEVFKQPRISQQIARLLYLHTDSCIIHGERGKSIENLNKWYKEAEEYAQKAVAMSSGKSHHLDTVGRVYKAKFNDIYPCKVWRNMTVTTAAQAIELGLEAIKWFIKCQTASTAWEQNPGFLGELQMMAQLMEMFLKLPDLQSAGERRKLQIYMSTEEIPEIFSPWEKHKDRLKRFQDRVHTCIRCVKEDISIFKPKSPNESTRRFDILQSCVTVYRHIFISDINDRVLSTLPEQNRNWAYINTYLMGEYFSNVFNIDIIRTLAPAKDPYQCLCGIRKKLEWNLKNVSSETALESRDLLAMVTVSMALHSPYGKMPTKSSEAGNAEYQLVYDLVDKYTRLEMRNRKPSLYAFLLKLMFLWPRDDNIHNNGTDYAYWLKLLRESFFSRAKAMQQPDQRELHPKYTKEPRPRVATTLFYLGEGHGLDVFVHVNELPRNSNNQVDLKSKKTRKRLRRVHGRRHDNNTIRVKNPFCEDEPLNVIYTDIRRKQFSREDVSFYLGFSFSGPIALDVKEDIHYSKSRTYLSQVPLSTQTREKASACAELPPVVDFEINQKELRKIEKKLAEIRELEQKEGLKMNQKEKLSKKEELMKRKEVLERNVVPTSDPFE